MSELALNPLLLSLVLTAIAVTILMALTALVGIIIDNHSIVDVVWGIGFVTIAVVSFGAIGRHGDLVRQLVVLFLVVVWGLRLAIYIGWRNRGDVDPRYVALMQSRKGPLLPFLIKRIYGLQGLVMWVVSLPVQVAMAESAPLGLLGFVGIGLWLVGFSFETVGDVQLARFRADPASKGKVLDSGLWAWTRHPNYFGDCVVWFGLWFLSLGHWAGLLTIISPLTITYMLLKVSGKGLTERRMARSRGPEYQDYLDRVSGFVPRPPRAR